MKIHVISLGCPRNLVDSEIMIGRLLAAGHTVVSDERDADCAVVNTCSFIEPAASESIDVILEMGTWKERRKGRRLIVVGCLPQRYGSDLVKDLPEVDAFLGTGALHRIVEVAEGIMDGRGRILLPHPREAPLQGSAMPRFRITPSHTAYLKIAEGCSGQCTYCIIPSLRGRQRSRPMEEVLEEAGALVASGVKELVLVAQNTMAYGEDLGPPHHLEGLLEGLSHLSGLQWVRLLYGHPDRVTDSLLETIASHSMICNYFDVPVQHISEPVLQAMGRRHDSTALFKLFDRIRRVVPEAALRTTLMVGFPGESDRDFQRLLAFVEDIRFDHLGAFIYSDETDLPSTALKNHVPDVVRQERYDLLMSRQREISKEVNRKYVGRTLKVLVEGLTEGPDAVWVGRTAFQAPEVDGVVYIEWGRAHPGMFAEVLITEACEYDLKGKIL